MKRKSLRLLVLHGPNLNLLGEREPEIYGSMTLAQMNARLRKEAAKRNIILKIFQSNHEGALIDHMHKNRKWAEGFIFNPGAYTHYSYALRDAVSACQIPTVEVHLSDIHSREDFRKVSVISAVCRKQISGHGWQSYVHAMDFFISGGPHGR